MTEDDDRVARTALYEEVRLRAGQHMWATSYLLPATEREGQAAFNDDCKGALLTVCVVHQNEIYPHGTGFMVMPGLAITAAHVFEDLLREFGAEASLFVLGTVGEQLFPWIVEKAHMGADVALLELRPRFDLPDKFEIAHFELTARLPRVDEPVLALGLVAAKERFEPGEDVTVTGVASAGYAVEQVPNAPLLPMLTAHCRFFAPSGMSGGPVFDANGRVFGILSNSLEGENGKPHDAMVPSLFGAMVRTIHPSWPEGLYQEASLWPGEVHEPEHFGIGNDEQGNMTWIYHGPR